jgi:hypothetical protein
MKKGREERGMGGRERVKRELEERETIELTH